MPVRKAKRKGACCEIKSVADIIKGKEGRGEDASFERNLLRSWSKYKGYETAKQALADCGRKPIH